MREIKRNMHIICPPKCRSYVTYVTGLQIPLRRGLKGCPKSRLDAAHSVPPPARE
jgi:hypothetical protein